MMPLYIILGGVVAMAIFAFVISYREDHPKKKEHRS